MFPVVLILFIVAFSLWADFRNGVHSRVKIPSSISIFIPWFDNAIQFGLDPLGFLRKRQTKHGSVFAIRLAGKRVIVAGNLNGILRVMRDTQKTLHLPNHQMLASLGDVKGTIPMTLLDRLTTYVARTFSNKGIPQFSHTFNQHLFRHIRSLAENSPNDRVPLQRFVGQALYDAVSVSVWGPHFPLDTYEEFYTIDAKMSRLLGPAFLVPRAVSQARNLMKNKLGTYMQECWDEELGVKGAPANVTEMIRLLKECSPTVPPEDAQGALLVFLFGLHANTHRIVAWLFLHLLSDSRTYLRLRREIDHAIDVEFGDLDTLLLVPPQRLGVSSLPLLESAIMETLRLWYAAVTVREVNEDTEIPSEDMKTFMVARPGDLVMGNSSAINMSDDFFEEPETFQIDRFVGCTAEKEDEGKSRTLPLGSFGGGTHVCKGRDFALYEMKVFAILCLRVLDMKAETSSGRSIDDLPLKADTTRTIPSFVMYPSEEVFVRIRKRA
ncbi:unnamed protein product [Somion occarium]